MLWFSMRMTTRWSNLVPVTLPASAPPSIPPLPPSPPEPPPVPPPPPDPVPPRAPALPPSPPEPAVPPAAPPRPPSTAPLAAVPPAIPAAPAGPPWPAKPPSAPPVPPPLPPAPAKDPPAAPPSPTMEELSLHPSATIASAPTTRMDRSKFVIVYLTAEQRTDCFRGPRVPSCNSYQQLATHPRGRLRRRPTWKHTHDPMSSRPSARRGRRPCRVHARCCSCCQATKTPQYLAALVSWPTYHWVGEPDA